MSRIVARRFMNLQWGSRYIVDNLVEYDPINNIECLANGGGKTVQIFLMNCLFVHRSYWRTRDKGDQYELKDYFKGNSSPGVVMVEMFLNGSEHRLLVGMIGNNRAGDFNVYTFVYEYKDPEDEMGIRHIPLSSIKDHVQHILSIPNAIAMLEKVKGMHIFDMNQNYQATAYYKLLLSYGISTKQWESVVMKINAEEGGITHFFKDTDERGIIRDYLFPVVESKLEGDHENDETNIQYIKDTFRSVADKRRQYDDRMKSSANMEDYISQLEMIDEKVNEQVAADQNLKRAADDIRHFGGILSITASKLEKQKADYMAQLNQIDEELHHIAQESASDEYYQMASQLKKLSAQYKNSNDQLTEARKVLVSAQKDQAILEYAQSYERYLQAQSDIEEGQMRLEKLTDESRQEKIHNLGYSLKLMTETAVSQMQKKIETLNAKIAQTAREIDACVNNLDKLNHEHLDMERTLTTLNVKIEEYREKEKEVLGYNGDFNMFMRHADDFFENIIKENETSIQNFNRNIANDQKSIKALKKQIHQDQESLTQNKIDLAGVTSQLNEAEEEKERADAIIENRRKLYEDLDPLNDAEIIRHLNDRIASLNESIEEDENRISVEEHHIHKLDGHLNETISEYLDDHEISYVSGLEYLRSQSQADVLIENNPLISYAFIISQEDDFATLKKADLPAVDDPVIFMKRSSIGDTIDQSINKGTIIYAHRDRDMLDLKKLESLKMKCQERIHQYQENNALRADKIKTYTDRRYGIEMQHLNRESYQEIIETIDKNNDEKRLLEDQNRHLQASLNDAETRRTELEDDLLKQQELLRNQEFMKKHVEKLRQDYTSYLDYLDSKSRIQNEIDENRKEAVKMRQVIHDMREAKENDTIREKDTEKDMEKYDLNKYSSYTEGTRISGGYEALSKQFETLRAQMSGDEAMARELIERGTKAADDAKRSCDQIRTTSELSDEDILDVHFDEDHYHDIQNQVSRLNLQVTELSEKTYTLKGQVQSKEEQLNQEKADIEKRFTALLKEDEIFGDYEKRMADASHRKDAIRQSADELNKRFDTIQLNLRLLPDEDYTTENIADEEVSDMLKASERDIDQQLSALNNRYDEAKENQDQADRTSGSAIIQLQTLDYLDVNKKEVNKRLLETHATHNAQKLSELLQFFMTNLRKQLALDREVTNEYHRDVDTLTSRIYEYISAFHNSLSRIDRYTAIDFDGTKRKLVEIRLAKWNENEKIVESKLKDYINSCFDESIQYEKGNELDDFIVKNINPLSLYDHTLTLDSIKIYALKIDVDHQIRERWDQYKSGGERTVSSMALVGALMSYMTAGLANDERHRPWSVFIMDNPFAQMTAHRLVKAFFEVASKQHVQLIMFTGVNEESVQKDAKRIIISRLNGGRIEVDDVIKNESQIESVTLSRQTSIFDF